MATIIDRMGEASSKVCIIFNFLKLSVGIRTRSNYNNFIEVLLSRKLETLLES